MKIKEIDLKRSSKRIGKTNKNTVKKKTTVKKSNEKKNVNSLINKLEIDQIELEAQNEELRKLQLSNKTLLKKYYEFFDRSPISYFILNEESKILEVNYSGIELLGRRKSVIIGSLFKNYVIPEFQNIFDNFIKTGFELLVKEKCEIKIEKNDDTIIDCYAEGILISIDSHNKGFLVSLIDFTDRKLIEDTNVFLLKSGWLDTDIDFFQALAKYLAINLKMDYVCIDYLLEENLSAKTVAIYYDGNFEDNVTYTLKDTPCGDVVGKTICYFPKDVRHWFPKDVILQDMVAESYVGITLWDSNCKPIGLIALIGRKPLDNYKIVESILKMVSIRTAGELERLRTNQSLEIALKHLKFHIENSPLAVIVFNNEFQIIEWSKRAEEIFGWSAEEVIGKRISDLQWVYEEDKERVSSLSAEMLSSKSTSNIHINRNYRKDGTVISCEWYNSALYDDSEKKLISVQSLILDITHRVTIEEALSKSSKKWQTTFNSITDMISIISIDHRIIDINKAGTEFIGMEYHEIIGRKCHEVVHKLCTPIDNCPCSRSLLTNKIETGELFENNKYYLLNTWPIFNENNEIIAFSHSLKDITERKQAEIELEKQKSFFEQSFMQSATSTQILDKDGWCLRINPKLSELFGILPEKIEGHIYNIFKDEEIKRNGIDIILRRVFNDLKTEKWEVNFDIGVAADSQNIEVSERKKIWYLNKAYPIVDSKGDLLYVVIQHEDITTQKQAEQERLRLQNLESLGIFAGGLAHDFNNILTATMGHVSNAIDLVRQQEIKDDLIAIEKATKRAVKLTQQLLTFAKGGAPNKSVIDLNGLIKDTTQFSLSGSNVSVEYDFKDSFKIEADPGQISQLIQNIVINSKQAMPNGGVIRISTKEDSHSEEIPYIVITIQDEGNGIPSENINKIFDPYYSTKETGSGLGLAVCHSIISRHDGKIFVESEINKGTKFTLYLPSTKKEYSEIEERKNIYSNQLNILIMDDEEEVREILYLLLTHLGHSVISTEEGEQACQIYKEYYERGEAFDLVIFDYTVKGGMGGKEAIVKLRKINPNVKAIVSSGYSDSAIANYKENGFDDVLKKPYTKNELQEVIYEVMNK